MDFLTGKIKPMYVKYLSAAFGSALISSIYGVVDMAMVGQYQGPDGTAALAVVAPIWNIIYSLGLLMGIGGSVLLSTLRGVSEKNQRQSNEYFSAALIGVTFLAVLSWLGVVFLDRELLTLFGAEETLLPLARQYLLPVKVVVPSFLFTQFLSAFLRNDGNPGLATKAVLFGGVFNVLGDYFFVFTLDMGIMGAGLATAMGSVFSLLMMLTHFRKKQNTLRWEWPTRLLSNLKAIGVTGFSTFFIDVAMGILTVLFNRQILKYLDTNALSVFGAEKGGRIREILKYALATAAVFGLVWTALAELAPNLFVRIFMTPTEEILAIAPGIIRSYGLSFLLLPLNVFSTYYFQAIMKPFTSFMVSVSRGALISGILICVLPAIAEANTIWLAMPLTELLVAIYVIAMMTNYTKRLPKEGNRTVCARLLR